MPLLGSILKIFPSPNRNRQFVFKPKIEYKMTDERERSEREALTFPKWCSREESNLDFKVRNLMSYPLNDGSDDRRLTTYYKKDSRTTSLSCRQLSKSEELHDLLRERFV